MVVHEVQWAIVRRNEDDKDDKYSNENTHVQEYLRKVEYQSKIANSDISKSPKPPSLISIRLGGKRGSACIEWWMIIWV